MIVRARCSGALEDHALYPLCEAPEGFFVETGRYEFDVSISGAAPPDQATLIVNGARIDQVTIRGRAFYPYEVGFHAGRLDITLLDGDRLIGAVEIEVEPERAKLTRDDYADMIADLARSTAALYRLGGLTMPSPTAASGPRSALVLLELVRACFDDFERASLRVLKHPNRRLSSGTKRTPVLRAKRADDRALLRAIRSQDSRRATPDEARSAPRLVHALQGRWVSMLNERRAEDEFDVYENRAILGFLVWLDRAIAGARQRLEATDELSASQLLVWLQRTRAWSRRLGILRRSPAFHGLVADPVLRSTSVFRMQPVYARLFTLMARIRSGLGVGVDAVPALPLERTFALYEMWVYVRLLLAVSLRFPSSRASVRKLLQGIDAPHRLGSLLYAGTASTLQLTPDIALTYQRRFAPVPDAEGCRTRLIEAYPDITLARIDEAGRCTGLVLLDPKYRRGASLLDGLRDLHVYRDAIRAADDRPLTMAAAAIAPRPFPFDESLVWAGLPAPGVIAVRPGQIGDVFDVLLENAFTRLGASGAVDAVASE